MPFGISGQYKMSISINKFDDFLTEDKFIHFILIDNIGFSIPYWEIKFDCVYPELLKYLNEKQSVIVQMGKTTSDLQPFTLVIKKPFIVPKTPSNSEVTLRGFINMEPFIEKENVYSSNDKISSLDLMKEFSSKYNLSFKSNLSSTKDKMIYMQPYATDYKFLFTEWLHSYNKDNDIIIPAITFSGKLKYNSLSKMIQDFDSSKDPIFVDKKSTSRNEKVVDGDQLGFSNTTLSNTLGNYMKERYIFDIENGKLTHVDVSNDTPIISESSTTSVSENISKSSGFYIQSSNVHENYYKQELINTQKWFSIQSTKQWVSVKDEFVTDVEPGNVTLYMTKKDNKQINDQLSGLYLVSRRVVSIDNRYIKTNFLLTRENMNYSK